MVLRPSIAREADHAIAAADTVVDMVMGVTEEATADMAVEEAAGAAATTAEGPALPEAAHLEEEKAPAKAQPDNHDHRRRQLCIVQQCPGHRYDRKVQENITP